MSAAALPAPERRLWGMAGAIALAAHAAVAGVVLALARPHAAPPPGPVMLVELPPMAAPAPQAVAPDQLQPQPRPLEAIPPAPPVDVPQVRAPLPQNPVTLPPPATAAPQPVRAAPAPAAAAAPMPLAPAPGPLPGDPRAKKAELDYFSLLSAHLNRRKSYPPEAKRAREEGVVTIRFTVDRDGNVSNAAIKRTSGHDLLDLATLDLLRRVAPLPRMPATMARDTVTIALPIEYALKTS